MEISTREVGTATVVDLVGDITLHNSPAVRKALLDLLEVKRVVRTVVNLRAVKYIDSSGVASLVEALKASRDCRTALALYGLSTTVREVLELTRLLKLFDIYADEESAVRGVDDGAGAA